MNIISELGRVGFTFAPGSRPEEETGFWTEIGAKPLFIACWKGEVKPSKVDTSREVVGSKREANRGARKARAPGTVAAWRRGNDVSKTVVRAELFSGEWAL